MGSVALPTERRQKLWLDCDPGHDDAIAILMALHLPLDLLGISTVHGNAPLDLTTLNAARLLASFTTPEKALSTPVLSGAQKPLLFPPKHDAEIHGEDGLGGVEGLPDGSHPVVQQIVARSETKSVVEAIAEAAKSLPTGEKMAIVATGTLTNVALFCATFPDLVRDRISEIVIMGGSEGRGNRSPTAEFNILCDPHAASIVFDAEIKVVLVPLNVTHTNLFTPSDDKRLLQPTEASTCRTKAKTQLRHTLSTLLNFFAATYAQVFGFNLGPPVHDPLCIAYLSHPQLFKGKRYRVDVETEGKWTAGTTSVDLYGYRDPELTAMSSPESKESWGRKGKNVWVAEEVDVRAFWQLFQSCVDSADGVSILNTASGRL